MNTALTIAAAMMLATGTGASAGNDANGAGAAAAAGGGAASAPAEKAKPRKYCLTIDATTGSRISRRECRTKAEWEEAGFDLKNAY